MASAYGIKVKDWYMREFPGDPCGEDLADVTWEDLYQALESHRDVYDCLGVADSIVRERCFSALADMTNLNYDDIYDMWTGTSMGNDKPSPLHFVQVSDHMVSLTEDELFAAYKAQQHIFDRDLVRNNLGNEDIPFSDPNKVDAFIDQVAYEMRNLINEAEPDENYCFDEALSEVTSTAVPASVREQEACDRLRGNGVLFAELPLSGEIGTIDVSLSLSATFEEHVVVAYDYMRRPDSEPTGEPYQEDWEVVKACVERNFPNAPWVLSGLDTKQYDALTGQELDSIIDWQDALTVRNFSETYASCYECAANVLSARIHEAVSSVVNDRAQASLDDRFYKAQHMAEMQVDETMDAPNHDVDVDVR